MTVSSKLSFEDFAGLMTGRISHITVGRATLYFKRLRATENGVTYIDDRFIMDSPTGSHSLLSQATDHDRLQAHWSGFCQKANGVHPNNPA